MLICDLFRRRQTDLLMNQYGTKIKQIRCLKHTCFSRVIVVCVLNPRELSYSLHRHVRNIINSPTYLDHRCIFHWVFSSRGTITRENTRVFIPLRYAFSRPPARGGEGGGIFRPSACVSGGLNIEAPIFNRATSILRLFLNIEVVFLIRQPQY